SKLSANDSDRRKSQQEPKLLQAARSFPADHGDALNLEQNAGAGEASHGDQRAAGKALLEDLLADIGQSIAVAHVAAEHGHGDHVLQPAAADRLDCLVEGIEDLASLAFEVGVG